MRTLSNRVLLLFASAILALFQFGVAAASADESTWTVIDGGRTNAHGSSIYFFDATTGSTAGCSDSDLIVRFRDGTGLSGAGLVMITYGTLNYCQANGGPPIEIHPRGLPWKMNATSYDAQTGTTTGTLTSDDAAGISVVASIDSVPCELTAGGPGTDKGEIQTTYNNETGELGFTDTNLVIKSASSSCGGLVEAGDPIMISAQYYVWPTPTITNP
ncbi:hypothetical protein SAMN05443665_101251 [Actinomadura meyerae]|uniref:Neocarzinostatin family protein n=1 Tax=Actinomadura meyerae TaxID=240840 RepID=A0A239ICW2_9ACTN|nr:hypothetical protein [Actinomadura meyerae]SNS90883.1 hypothetical protein SAMN05443665_101251 [Actinomadura meyerae]